MLSNSSVPCIQWWQSEHALLTSSGLQDLTDVPQSLRDLLGDAAALGELPQGGRPASKVPSLQALAPEGASVDRLVSDADTEVKQPNAASSAGPSEAWTEQDTLAYLQNELEEARTALAGGMEASKTAADRLHDGGDSGGQQISSEEAEQLQRWVAEDEDYQPGVISHYTLA